MNEIRAILAVGGRVVRIDRPGVVAKHPMDKGLTYYDEWSEVIVNDGSLEDLAKKVEGLL